LQLIYNLDRAICHCYDPYDRAQLEEGHKDQVHRLKSEWKT
jgi:hypothetical protein